jgi:rsbT co-antagonist protein RsbR
MSDPPIPTSPGADSAPALLRVIQETLPIMVFEIDRKGTHLRMEGAGLERLGRKPGQFVGQNVFEIFPEGTAWLDHVRRAIAGQPAHIIMDFGGLPWETWMIPIRDERGEVQSVVSIVLDITEAKRSEKELLAQLELTKRQQDVISLLSTPIIEVWEKVLTLPLFGVLDSGRAASVMEKMLTEVSQKEARFAILDMTGVDAVDTSTADHMLKLIRALRLLGAEGIITGIQPTVAQTMITLGVDLKSIVTCANLREGLRHCIARLGDDATRPERFEAQRR